MAKIIFKTKLIKVYNVDDSFAFTQINVPKFSRSHLDMNEFRSHPKYGPFANSSLFESILVRIRKEVAPNGWLKLENLPETIKVDTNGFLAIVTIEV